MSEYGEKITVSRLTGPPPGYAGYDEGGQLTEAVRRSPHSVVLFDELEKAHGDVLNILLALIDDGVLTDGKGRTVSFKNTILIMTSNIGSKRILDIMKERENAASDDSSSSSKESNYNQLASAVKSELMGAMKPEFLNRIDDIVVFEPLTHTELSMIAAGMVAEITARAQLERDVEISVTQPLLDKMVQEGSLSASQFGARPMRRAVQRVLEDAISDGVVQGFLTSGDVAVFDLVVADEGEVVDPASNSFTVRATRARDDAALDIVIESSARDMVMETTAPPPASKNKNDEDGGGGEATIPALAPNGAAASPQ